MMFSQQTLPLLMVLLMASSVMAFAPLGPQSGRFNSRREVAVDPSDIASSITQIADQHPTMEALISTLYTATIKNPEAHGHSQSLFGPVDVYLKQMESIAPATKGTLPTIVQDADIPDKIRGTFDYARAKPNFVDPTTIIRIDSDASPGFAKMGNFFPNRMATPAPTTDYQLGVMNQEVFNLRALQKVPLAALLTVIVDFFVVSPGIEVFKEEIEEEGDRVMQEAVMAGTARVAVLAVVAGLTLMLA